MRRGAWATALLLVVTGVTTPARGQPVSPLGVLPPPAGATAPESLPPAAEPVRRTAPPDHPPPILGAPVAVPGLPVRPNHDDADSRPLPAAFTEPPAEQKPGRAAGLGAPIPTGAGVTTAAGPIPAGTLESRVKQVGATTPPPADPVNDFLARRSDYKTDAPAREADRGPRSSGKFGDRLEGVLGERGGWFCSDHAFDGFISPVTNPFLFEDPRSLTEVRPIFMYQRIPGGQPDFFGGNISYFGVQGRLAITQRLSFVVHKLGGIWLNPNDPSPVGGEAGFAEVWLGPKFTFIRNEASGSLLAGGLQFQLPVGSKGAFQDTGSLSLVPYVSAAQNLFRDFSWGGFNVMGTTGYSFSTTKARTDYFYLSGHLDWDVMNWHRLYPLVELNYLVNTTDGNTYPIGVEGRDLINFGGQAKGKGLLTGAFGARFKISESAQVGAAFEFPFAGPRDLMDYRFTVDFILRY